MAILVQDGRIAVAHAIQAQDIYLAWGRGQATWDSATNPPDPQTTIHGLVDEIGRRKANQVQYCERVNSGGSIFVGQNQFNVTTTETNFLYIRVAFDYPDAAGEPIRELGVFVGAVLKPTADPTKYLLPTDFSDVGRLLVAENIQKLQRSADVRQQFEFVIQF
ncbi:hypothetical protein MF451_003702 [Salmonella enterica subsp. enterica serovar Saintpaul]|nr:hypothetical protein [Salmonella enterica subsp. enterica serovar Saintpaul]